MTVTDNAQSKSSKEAEAKGALARLKRTQVARVAGAYGESKAGNFAAGLAFNGFMTMFPLILGLLSILGLVVRDPKVQGKFQDAVASIFPADAHTEILTALQGVKHSAGLLGLVSILGLLWGGTSLFGSMEFALTEIFGTKQRDAVRQRLMGLVMVVVFLSAVIVAVVANSAAAATAAGGVLGVVVAAAVLVGLMGAIYRFVPNRTFTFREVLPGAVVAGLSIEVFTLAFPLYAKVSHGFNSYGQQFALFFMLAAWLGFLSQFILLGAVFNRMRLGSPTDSGLIASSPGDSESAPRPVDAIEKAQRGDEGDKSGSEPRELVGQHTGTAHAAKTRAKPAQARVALGAAAVATVLGVAATRARRR